MSSYTITILLAIVFLPSVEAGVAVVCNTSTVATDIVTNCSAAGLYDLSFGINSNTTILDLSHNLLTGIPPGVAVLLHLSQLFLHGNNITEVKVPRELNLSQLSVFTLHNNPIDCDCELQPFLYLIEQLKTSDHLPRLLNLSTCSQPHELKDVQLTSLFVEVLNCSACNSNPCENGGSCKSGKDGFQCLCLPTFTGKQCENLITSNGLTMLGSGATVTIFPNPGSAESLATVPLLMSTVHTTIAFRSELMSGSDSYIQQATTTHFRISGSPQSTESSKSYASFASASYTAMGYQYASYHQVSLGSIAISPSVKPWASPDTNIMLAHAIPSTTHFTTGKQSSYTLPSLSPSFSFPAFDFSERTATTQFRIHGDVQSTSSFALDPSLVISTMNAHQQTSNMFLASQNFLQSVTSSIDIQPGISSSLLYASPSIMGFSLGRQTSYRSLSTSPFGIPVPNSIEQTLATHIQLTSVYESYASFVASTDDTHHQTSIVLEASQASVEQTTASEAVQTEILQDTFATPLTTHFAVSMQTDDRYFVSLPSVTSSRAIGPTSISTGIPGATLVPPTTYTGVITPTMNSQDSNYVGCFQNDSMSTVPLSGYVKLTGLERTSASVCQQMCKLELYLYSASHNGSNCFCGNWLPFIQVGDSKCDTACVDNDLEFCGGSEFSSVFETSVLLVNLSGPDFVIQYGTAGFSVSVHVGQSEPANETTFQLDFGDGNCLVLSNVPVHMVAHRYMLPGNYSVRLTVAGTGKLDAISERWVSVLAQPKLSLLFNESYSSHNYSLPGRATLLQGTMVTVLWSTTHHNESIFYIDVPVLPLGHPVPQTSFTGAMSQAATPVAYLGEGIYSPSDVFIFPHLMEMNSSGILEAVEFELSGVLSQFEGIGVQLRFQVYRPVCVEPNTKLLSCPDTGGLGSCYPINNATCSGASQNVSSHRYLSYIPHYTLIGVVGINMTQINNYSHHLVIFGSEEISVKSGDVFGLQFEAISDSLPFQNDSDSKTTVVKLLFGYDDRRWIDIGKEAPSSNFSYVDIPQPLIRVYVRFPTVLFPPVSIKEQILAEDRGISQTVIVLGRNMVGETEQSMPVTVYDPVANLSLVCPQLLGDDLAVATNKSMHIVVAIEQGTAVTFHYRVNDAIYNVSFAKMRNSVLCHDYEYSDVSGVYDYEGYVGGGFYATVTIPLLFTTAGTYHFYGIARNPLDVTAYINFTITVQDVITLHGLFFGHDHLSPMDPVALAKDKEQFFEVVVTGGIPMLFDWYFSDTNETLTTPSNIIGHVFSSVGDGILITVQVRNNVSTERAIGLVSVQEPVDRPEIIPRSGFVPVNDSVVFLALLGNGSHISYQWIFIHKDNQESFFFDPVEYGGKVGARVHYTFEREGRYVLSLVVFNNISNASAWLQYTAVQKVSLNMTVDSDSVVKLGSSAYLGVLVEGTLINLTVSSNNRTYTFFNISSNLFQINITLPSVGNHTITAHAMNPVSSAKDIAYVLVEEAVNISHFIFNETISVGDALTINVVVSAGSNLVFKWEWNDTTIISSDPVLTFFPAVSGLYLINVTVSNAVSHITSLIGPVRVVSTEGCVLSSCANGGSCHFVDGRYQCLCPSGWEGERCLTATPSFPAIFVSCPAVVGQFWITHCSADFVVNVTSNTSELSYTWHFGSSSLPLAERSSVARHVFSVPGNYTILVLLSVNSHIARSETSVLVLGLPVIVLEIPSVFNSELSDFSILVNASLLGGSEVYMEWSVDGTNLSAPQSADVNVSVIGMDDYHAVGETVNITAVVSSDGAFNLSDVYLLVQHAEAKQSGLIQAFEFTVSDSYVRAASRLGNQPRRVVFQVYRPVCPRSDRILFACPEFGGLPSCYPVNGTKCRLDSHNGTTYRYLSDPPSYSLVGQVVGNLADLGNAMQGILVLKPNQTIRAEAGDVLGYQSDVLLHDYEDAILRSSDDRKATVIRVSLASQRNRLKVGDEIGLAGFEYQDRGLSYLRAVVASPVTIPLPETVQNRLLATTRGINSVVVLQATNPLSTVRATASTSVDDPIQQFSLVCPSLLSDNMVALTSRDSFTLVFRISSGTNATLQYYTARGDSGSSSFSANVTSYSCLSSRPDQTGLFSSVTASGVGVTSIRVTAYAFNRLQSYMTMAITVHLQDRISSVTFFINDTPWDRQFFVGTEQDVLLRAEATNGSDVEYTWTVIRRIDPFIMTKTGMVVSHRFDQQGDYYVLLEAANYVSRFFDTRVIRAEEVIRGLTLLTTGFYATPNETVVFEASVLSGSHVTFNWSFTHDLSGHRDEYIVNGSLNQSYRFLMEGEYDIKLVAQNDLPGQEVARRSIVVVSPLRDLVIDVPSQVYVEMPVDVIISFTGFFVNVTVTAGNETLYFYNLMSGIVKAMFTFARHGFFLVNVTALNPVSTTQSASANITVDREPVVNLVPGKLIFSETGHQVVVNATIIPAVPTSFEWFIRTDSHPNGTVVSSVGAHVRSNETYSTLSVMSGLPTEMRFTVCFTVVRPGVVRCAQVVVIFETSVLGPAVSLVPVNSSFITHGDFTVYIALNQSYRAKVSVQQGCPVTMFAMWDRPEYVLSFSFPSTLILPRENGCTINTTESGPFMLTSPGQFTLYVNANNTISSENAQVVVRVEVPVESFAVERTSNRSVYTVNDTLTLTGDASLATDVRFQWSVDYQQALQLLQEVSTGTVSRVTYKVSQEGMFVIFVKAANHISSRTANVTVTAQIPLSNLHIVHNQSVVDDRRLTIAVGKTLRLEAASFGSAPQYKWEIRSVSSLQLETNSLCGSSAQIPSTSENKLSIVLASPGLRSIVLCAKNLVTTNFISAKMEVDVQEVIDAVKLTVQPSTTVLQNSTVTFSVELGNGTSVVYNWTVTKSGSSVTNVISSSSVFRFNFTVEGNYIVSIAASNDVSSRHLLQTVIYVQPRLCLPPLLTAITLPLVQEQLRSRSFQLEVSATPNCTLFKIRYQWVVYPKSVGVDCSVLVATSKQVELKDIVSVNPIITIPSRFLQLETYCFRFEASLGSTLSTETFVVSIKESDLVATIEGGDLRLIGALQPLKLDGTNSYDPDDDGTVPQTSSLSYLWSCRSTPSVATGDVCENVQDTGLFVEDSSCLTNNDLSLPVLTIVENTLQANRTYLFQLRVSEGMRMATARQQVCVTAGDPPEPPSIGCLSCDRYGTEEFISSKRTELVVQCKNADSCAGQTFQWRLFNVTNDSISVPVILDNQMTSTGTNGRNLVINSNVLDSRTTYRFELRVTERNREGVGFSSVTLRPNAPPSGGTCDVSPRQGKTLSTQFTFTCTGWLDNDSPLEYRFATSQKKTAVGRDRAILYTGFRSQYVADSLPLGDERNNYTIYVFVSVIDRFGGETEVDMNNEVLVEPLTTTAVEEAALNALNRIEKEFGDDPQKVTETCGSIMDSINLVAETDEVEAQTDQAKRSSLRQTCIGKLESQTVESVEDAIRIAPVLIKATSKAEEFENTTTQKAVLNTIDKIVNALGDGGDGEDTEESAAQVLEVVSNVIQARQDLGTADNDDANERGLTNNIVDQVQNIGNVLAGSQVVGEVSSVIEAPQVTIIASKTDPTKVGRDSSSLQYRDVGFSLGSGFGTELSNKTNSSEMLQSVYSLNSNPFSYSQTSSRVNSKVVGLVLKTTGNEVIQIDNLPKDSEFTVTLPRSETANVWKTTQTSVQSSYTFLHLNVSELSDDEAMYIEVRLVHSYTVKGASKSSIGNLESEAVEVYFLEHESPVDSDVTAESYQFTLTLDMFSHASNISHQNYTIFLLSSSVNMSTSQFIVLKSRDSQLGFNVSVRVFYSVCLFWDEKNESYSSYGCQPTAQTTFDLAVCRCNHLTSFASGMFPAPNPIDFSEFTSLDIASNPIALVTLILVYAVYVVAVVFARRADLRDERYVTEVPFCGPTGRFVYEVSVQTGFWFGSGTTANVGIILCSGDTASEKRHLYREGAFRRSSFDVFRISFEERLGPIDKIRVWHDNKGKSPSWNVDRIQVKDMQSREVFSFIFSDWMSVDSDTGLIDVEISSATDKDMKRFWNIFSMQTSRGFSERHLWLSVVERPARNRFTRVQRVSCCLCLFISFITASAMWYGIAPEGKTDFDLGFVELSYQQIGISVMAIAVTFPLNMLWITMFRKARVKTDGNSAVDGGGDNSVVVNNCQTDDPVLLSYNQLTLDVHAINDSKFTGSSKSSTSPVSVEDLDNGENSRQRYGANIASNNETIEEEPSASNKCRLELPHYFVYVAYIGCFTTCLAGSVIILIYGQQFGRTKALQWVASMFLSFFESILFFEPIKVLVIATFLALLVKPKSAIDDDIVYNARVKHIEGMEMGEVKVLTDDDRAAARTRRQKHKHMINVIWEIVLYFIFLWLVAVIAYTDRDERAFYMTKISERVFDVEESFSEIKTGENFFEWANSTLVDGLYWDRWYNSDPVHYSGFTKGDVGKLLGGARLRQIRVKNGSCNVPGTFEKQIKECYSQKKAGNERGSFGLGWTDSGNTTDPPWRWSSVSELDGVAYWGKLDVYSGDGYVQYLENTRSKARNVLATLKDNLWIDRQTRAVFVEFTLYNANANLFQSVTFLIEFPATGGAVPSYQFLSVRLIRYISSLDSLKMACEIMFIFFILLYTYRFCKEARNTGIKAFMKFFWTWVDICLLLLSYAAIIYAIYRIVAINDLLSRYSASRGQFINFYPTVLANMAMQYVLAFLGFLVTVKVLKLFRFNRRLTMLGLVLKTAAWEIFSILVFLVAVLWTFAQFGYLVLQENAEFHSLGAAMVTLISTTLGEFDFYGWVDANRILAPILFFFFNISVFFILLSVFMASLNISASSVRQSVVEQDNDFEVLDFMLRRIRLWLGFKSEANKDNGDTPSVEDSSSSRQGTTFVGDLEPTPECRDVESSLSDISLEGDLVASRLDTLSSKMDTVLDILDGLLRLKQKPTLPSRKEVPPSLEILADEGDNSM